MLAPHGDPRLIILLYAVLAVLVNFQYGYSNSYPNTSYESFRCYLNESYVRRGEAEGLSESALTWLWSLILNVWFIGYLAGVLATPLLSDVYGRRLTILTANVISLLGTLICTLGIVIRLPELYLFGRVVEAASCGISFTTLIVFIQETTPTDMRGMCSFFSEMAFIATNVIGMGMGLSSVLGEKLPYLVGFGAIPGILAIAIMLPLKETPKFLLIHNNDHEAAIEALTYYLGPQDDFAEVIAHISKEALDETNAVPVRQAIRDVATQPGLRQALILGIMSLTLVNGLWPVIYLSTDILGEHFSPSVSQYASFAFSISNLTAAIVGSFFVDRFGRRPMMLGAGLLNMGGLVGYIFFDQLSKVNDRYAYGCIGSLIWFGITYGGALGPIAYFITTELCPQRYRSLIQSLVFGFITIMGFFFSFITLPMYRWISSWALLPLYIIPSGISLIYLYLRLPETKGREIHEIVTQMASKGVKNGGIEQISLDGDAQSLSTGTSRYRVNPVLKNKDPTIQDATPSSSLPAERSTVL